MDNWSNDESGKLSRVTIIVTRRCLTAIDTNRGRRCIHPRAIGEKPRVVDQEVVWIRDASRDSPYLIKAEYMHLYRATIKCLNVSNECPKILSSSPRTKGLFLLKNHISTT